MALVELPVAQIPPGDPRLVETIVGQLKSKGIFDQFRKECLADVDTKPAFQNLRQRVEGQVEKFLEKQVWRADLNKNQLRDGVRKHLLECGILDSGIDAIVQQVIAPKVTPIILPYVEDAVYDFLQLEKPKRDWNDATDFNDKKLLSPAEENKKPVLAANSLLPMETDTISSGEDDILAQESPSEKNKAFIKKEENLQIDNDDARDGFENEICSSVTSQVEQLQIKEDFDSKEATQASSQALFDQQSLDSISSNSSGLSFSSPHNQSLIDDGIKVEVNLSSSLPDNESPKKSLEPISPESGEGTCLFSKTEAAQSLATSDNLLLSGASPVSAEESSIACSDDGNEVTRELNTDKSEGEISSSSSSTGGSTSSSSSSASSTPERTSKESSQKDSKTKKEDDKKYLADDHYQHKVKRSHSRDDDNDRDRGHSKPYLGSSKEHSHHHHHQSGNKSLDKKSNSGSRHYKSSKSADKNSFTGPLFTFEKLKQDKSKGEIKAKDDKNVVKEISNEKNLPRIEGEKKQDVDKIVTDKKLPTTSSKHKQEEKKRHEERSESKKDLPDKEKNEFKSGEKRHKREDKEKDGKLDKKHSDKKQEKLPVRELLDIDMFQNVKSTDKRLDQDENKRERKEDKEYFKKDVKDTKVLRDEKKDVKKEIRNDKCEEKRVENNSKKEKKEKRSDKLEEKKRENDLTKQEDNVSNKEATVKKEAKLDTKKYRIKNTNEKNNPLHTNITLINNNSNMEADSSQLKGTKNISQKLLKENVSNVNSKRVLKVKSPVSVKMINVAGSVICKKIIDTDTSSKPVKKKILSKSIIKSDSSDSDEPLNQIVRQKKKLPHVGNQGNVNELSQHKRRKTLESNEEKKIVSNTIIKDSLTKKNNSTITNGIVLKSEGGGLMILSLEDDSISEQDSVPGNLLSDLFGSESEDLDDFEGFSDTCNSYLKSEFSSLSNVNEGKSLHVKEKLQYADQPLLDLNKNLSSKTLKFREEEHNFEGFTDNNFYVYYKLKNLLDTAMIFPDEMDVEYANSLTEEDLSFTVNEDTLTKIVDMNIFLNYINKLGACVFYLTGRETPDSENIRCSSSEAYDSDISIVKPFKKRKLSESSVASSGISSLSPSESPRIKRSRIDISPDVIGKISNSSIIGYALPTPEDDGHRTSEVDYSKQESYSPLSPASDSSSEVVKTKGTGAIIH